MPDDDLAVVPAPTSALSTLDAVTQAEVERRKVRPRAASTIRAYKTDWTKFIRWCSHGGHRAFPASEDVVVAYILELGQRHRPATLLRSYATIRVIHDLKKQPLPQWPGVRNAITYVRRLRAAAELPNEVKKRALEAEQVIEAARRLPPTLTGLRDRVVLLFGFAVGQRRADIARIRVSDLEPVSDGLKVTIRRSKTDQDGKGLIVPVIREGGPGCPVRAVEEWLEASGIEEGWLVRRIHARGGVHPKFLSGHGIGQVVKSAAKSLGLDPREYGGHSLRRGFVTSAALAGKPTDAIMQTTGHKSVVTVLGYIDESTRVKRAAGRGLLKAKGKEAELGEQWYRDLKKDSDLDLLLFHQGERGLTKRAVLERVEFLRTKKGYSLAGAIELLGSKIGITRHGRPIEVGDLA